MLAVRVADVPRTDRAGRRAGPRQAALCMHELQPHRNAGRQIQIDNSHAVGADGCGRDGFNPRVKTTAILAF